MEDVEFLQARIRALEDLVAQAIRRHPELAEELDPLRDPRLIPLADWARMMQLGPPSGLRCSKT